MLPLFAATIFLGALLLFLVQPMVARMLLPSLGGSPAVWNTCMLFFQAALLAGYAWAHWGTRRLGPRRLAIAHIVALALPIIALARWGPPPSPPQGASPILYLLGAFALTVGLPFLLVSTTAPLLQRWFAATDHPAAKDPYFLYAASNAGSLLALVAYPGLIEWTLGLDAQRRAWSIGYVALALLVAACALTTLRRARGTSSTPDASTSRPQALTPSPPHPLTQSSLHPLRARLLWVALAAVPSSLMLGVTQYISTDIAAVPLLWVVPLAVYLLTYILAFAGRPLIPLRLLTRALPLMAIGLAVCMMLQAKHPVGVILLIHVLTFFAAALLCHTRLALSRPAPEHLTGFYLFIALGGVLGGVFNALLAPLIFKSIAEYPIALALACMLRPWPAPAGDSPWWRRAMDIVAPMLILAAALVSESLVGLAEKRAGLSPTGAEAASLICTVGLPAFLAYLTLRRPLRFALALGTLLWLANTRATPAGEVLRRQRTFFGVYNVVRSGQSTTLYHGTTMHGQQFVDPERRSIPLSYYHPDGPIGQVFETFGDTPLFDRVGLVGLGSGSLAAYGRPGQRMTFFELDPAVARIASNAAWFTYLADCEADFDIRLGDGRLTLRDSAAEGEFGLIVLDAFTSDAIPVHLVTREALALYVSRLKPGGLIAFHISNQYLDLAPVIARMAQDLGLVSIARVDHVDRDESLKTGRTGCTWVLVAREQADFGALLGDSRWSRLLAGPRAPLWTDDYSNIFRVFKWN